jgi:hypothetical protein
MNFTLSEMYVYQIVKNNDLLLFSGTWPGTSSI